MIFVTLKQEVDYYPFGMTMRMPDKSSENKYLYNPEKLRFFEPLAFRGSSKNYANHRFAIFRDGKEFQDDLGLDWYDYGARMPNCYIAKLQIKFRSEEMVMPDP